MNNTYEKENIGAMLEMDSKPFSLIINIPESEPTVLIYNHGMKVSTHFLNQASS